MKLQDSSQKSPLPPLQAGDKVALIAPSYGITARGVADCVGYIKGLGLEPWVPEGLLGDDLLSANSDESRQTQLVEALTHPDIKAVWPVRGGYGATKLVKALKEVTPPASPRWLIGFSDITCIHAALNQWWGWPTLHAPVCLQVARGEVDAESINALEALLLRGEMPDYPALEPMNKAALEAKTLPDAPIVGGNLALVQCSVGTNWEVTAKDAILFLEDVDERGYRLERTLTHLKQAGIAHEAFGLLLGDFSGGDDPADSYHGAGNKVEAVLERFARSLCKPVFRLRGVGHEARNLPLWLGV